MGGNIRDRKYRTDGMPQQIVWAIGPLNSAGGAAKHYAASAGGRISSVYF